MIQIKLTNDQHEYIEKKHWEWFIKSKAEKFAEEVVENSQLKEYFFINQSEFNTWKQKKSKDKYDIFKPLITGNIDELKKIKNAIGELKKFKTKKSKAYKNRKWFEDQYKNFRSIECIDGKWGGRTFVESLDLRTCPYCNRNFIDTYKIDGNNEIRDNAQIDHFFPKEKYPYFSISLYNLIPCCAQCNHIKSNNMKEIVYPYSDTINDAMNFKIDFLEDIKNNIDNIDVLYGKSDKFNISINLNNIDNKIANNVEIFKLDKLYETHKEHVKNLIKKSIVYNETTINELYDQYPNLFKDESEIKEIIFNTYRNSDNFNKSPLSKLNYDICKDLDISI